MSMLLDPQDLVSRTILETGSWQPDVWEVINAHLTAGATFIDIGAHIGYFSLKAAPVVGARGRVIAIEPDPETLRTLRDNIEASRAKTISVQPVACADSEGTLEFFAAPRANTGGSSLSRDVALSVGPAIRTYRVRSRPLDAIVQEAGISRVDMIKIDVEGAELRVLKGARQSLARFHPALVVEINEKLLRWMGTSSTELIEFLRLQGYAPHTDLGGDMEFMPIRSQS